MIYVATYNTFVLFDTSPGFSSKSIRTKCLAIGLLSFDVLFSIT